MSKTSVRPSDLDLLQAVEPRWWFHYRYLWTMSRRRSLLTWASTWHWIYTASIYIYIYLYIQVLALFFRNWLFRRTSLFILYVFGEQLLSLLVPSFADSKGVWITWLGNSIHSSLASIWRGTWMHNVDLLTTQCSIHYNIISYIISCHIIACYITWI